MAQVYFHCSTAEGVLIDQSGAALGDLGETLDYAALVIQSLIMSPSLEDWRSWVLHVSEDSGDEIFVVPFASTLGKPH
jgi:hypothetical protein